MKKYETCEALKLLSENETHRFVSVFNDEVGTLEMKFECGVVKIRNQNGVAFDLSISIFRMYKWVIGRQ